MTTFAAVVRRGGGWLPLIGLAGLMDAVGDLALPLVLGNALDALVTGRSSMGWVLLATGLITLGITLEVIDAYAGTACVAGTTAWLRRRIVRQVFAAGPHGEPRFDTGDLVSRISAGAGEAAQAGPGIVGVLTAVLPPVGSLVLLALLDIWLAVALLAGLAVVTLVLRTFALRTTEAIAAYLRIQGQIAARLAEALAGIRTIAAAGTAEWERRRVLATLPELHAQGTRTWRVLARSTAQATLIGPLVLVAVLAAGGIELSSGRISPGELFAASQYAAIGAGLGSLTGGLGQLARARAGVGRTAEVLAVPAVAHGPRPLPAGRGRLEFHGVTARAGDGRALLAGVDLVVAAGAAVAVVGRSGAGKSVLVELAGRLRDPDDGQVLLDGVPLAALDRNTLRAAIGCAFERPVLVGATVGDAISVGRPPDAVRAAAAATHADGFIRRLPLQYDTPLADAPFSGGELQRLGLARAWHADRVLLLDDATSSLDTVTEMHISDTLTRDHAGRTRLIVTHRAATAARADTVVWLDAGRVRAVGRHDELCALPGYREVFG